MKRRNLEFDSRSKYCGIIRYLHSASPFVPHLTTAAIFHVFGEILKCPHVCILKCRRCILHIPNNAMYGGHASHTIFDRTLINHYIEIIKGFNYYTFRARKYIRE